MNVDLTSLRQATIVEGLAHRLRRTLGNRETRIMHLCGTHEHTVSRWALRSLIGDSLQIVAGPGCPVCVCPARDIDTAISLAASGAVLTTFGDMVRVPGNSGSLLDARTEGAQVLVVGSVTEAIATARSQPHRDVVFFAVGFETTACTYAAAALSDVPANFTMLTSIRTIPPALEALIAMQDVNIDGYLLPGHVCTVIGLEPFEPLSGGPVAMAVAGFEPADVMQGLLHVSQRIVSGEPGCGNSYSRLVRRAGNRRAREMMQRVFEPVDAHWRGIGSIASSGLVIRRRFEKIDARARFGVTQEADPGSSMPPGCCCGDVLTGRRRPTDCVLFDAGCTPAHPRGPCMISQEGACRITHELGRDTP